MPASRMLVSSLSLKITYILLFEGENYLSFSAFNKEKMDIICPSVQSVKELLALPKSLSCPLGTTEFLSPTLWGQDGKDGIPSPGGIPGLQKLLGHLLFPAALELAVFMPPFLRLTLWDMISLWPKSCPSVKQF